MTLAFVSILESYIYGCILTITSITCIIILVFYIRKLNRLKANKDESTRMLNAIAKSASISIWKYSIDEDEFHSLLGKEFPFYDKKEEDLANTLLPDDKDRFHKFMDELKKGKRTDGIFIGEALNKETRRQYFIRMHTFVHTEQNNTYSIVGSYKELSKDFMTIESGQKELRKLQTAFNVIKTGVAIYNPEGILEDINLAAMNIYGIKDKNDFLSQHTCIYDNPNYKNLKEKVEVLDYQYEYDYDAVKSLGQNMTCKTGKSDLINSIHHVTNSNGELECTIFVTNDITDNLILNKKYEKLYNESDLILKNLPVGVAIFDKNGIQNYANDAYMSILGITDREEYLSLHHDLFKNPLAPIELKEKIKDNDIVQYFASADFSRKEYRDYYLSTFNTQKDYQLTFLQMHSKIGLNEGYLVIVTDVTESKMQRRMIEALDYEMSDLMEAGGLSSWILNLESGIRETTQGFCYMPPKFSEDDYRKYFQYDDALLFEKYISDLKNGSIEKTRNVIRYFDSNKEGGYAYLEMFSVPRKENGKITKIACISRDITEATLLQQNLERSKTRTNLAFQGSEMSQYDFIVAEKKFIIYYNDHIITEKVEISLDEYVSFFHPEDAAKYTDIIERMCKGDDFSFTIDYRIRANDNAEWLSMRSINVPLDKSPDGKVLIYTGLRRNNTRWQKLMNDIEESNLLLQTIIDRMPCIFFMKNVDDNFRYMIANANFCDIQGRPKEEIVGRTDYDLMETKEEADAYRRDDISALKEESISVQETTYWKGKRHVWHTSKSSLTTQTGQRLLLAMSLDITSLNDAFIALQHEKEKAEQSDKLKSAFLANMSHEIRTPLNSIVGFSELLTVTEEPERREEYGKIITTNSDFLLSIINNILDLSKIEAGYIDLYYEPVDLSSMFSDLYNSFLLKMNSGVTLIYNSNPSRSYIINTDKNKLIQVINNYISNAIKYTGSGEIELGFEEEDKGVKIYVRDTGSGISEENKKRVFNRFEKLGSCVQGTGLGLSITKAIVETLGGRVGFESVLGKGSYFWAWMPNNPPKKKEDR